MAAGVKASDRLISLSSNRSGTLERGEQDRERMGEKESERERERDRKVDSKEEIKGREKW